MEIEFVQTLIFSLLLFQHSTISRFQPRRQEVQRWCASPTHFRSARRQLHEVVEGRQRWSLCQTVFAFYQSRNRSEFGEFCSENISIDLILSLSLVNQFEDLYKAAHAAIRADPSPSPKKEKRTDGAKPKRYEFFLFQSNRISCFSRSDGTKWNSLDRLGRIASHNAKTPISNNCDRPSNALDRFRWGKSDELFFSAEEKK